MGTIFDILNNFVSSWHAVVLALGIVFILATAGAWGEVIKRLSLYIKKKDLMITTGDSGQTDVQSSDEYVKIQATLSDLNINADREFKDFLSSVKDHLLQKNLKREEVRELIHSIFIIKEQYEFAYLNLFLVANSKLALKTLFDLGSATKEVFFDSIDISQDSETEASQKEVIFNALLCHHLLENSDGIYTVSEKGERLIKFIGLA